DQFEVELRVSKAGSGIGSINELTPFINEHGHLNLLLNWDNGQGPMVANNSLNVADDGALGDGCEAQGEGLFLCHKDFTDAAIKPTSNSTLTVNIADMPLCANRRDGELAECVTFEGIDLIKSPFVIAANNASGSFDVSGINKQHKLPVSAHISSCNDCHKELTIHKLGEHPHA
ncbi:cytochrome C, partial [Vibrio sp. 1075]|nr:cytochrome C [Vibrio sp. 1075]